MRRRAASVARRAIALALLIALVFSFRSRVAHAFTHVVKPGESLATIAARVYGDPKLESLLAAANGLDAEGGVAPVAGMRLEIPAPGHHRVAANETWPALADRMLGAESRSDVLARANGAVPWVPPDRGQEIVVPYVLAVISTEADRLDTIAKRFWGDPNRAWELDAYNVRKGAPLKRGEVVLVPLSKLSLTEQGKLEARAAASRAASESEGHVLEVQTRAEREASELSALLRAGRYVEAATRASGLIGAGVLLERQEAPLQRILVEAFVALDAKEAAAKACVRWRAIDQKARLDPVRTSPKIRAVCATR